MHVCSSFSLQWKTPCPSPSPWFPDLLFPARPKEHDKLVMASKKTPHSTWLSSKAAAAFKPWLWTPRQEANRWQMRWCTAHHPISKLLLITFSIKGLHCAVYRVNRECHEACLRETFPPLSPACAQPPHPEAIPLDSTCFSPVHGHAPGSHAYGCFLFLLFVCFKILTLDFTG